MSELLPCPFCGGRADLLPPMCRPETPYNPRDRLFPLVRCSACLAEAYGANEDYKCKSAVAAWNRRAPSAPAQTPEWIAEYRKRMTALNHATLVAAHKAEGVPKQEAARRTVDAWVLGTPGKEGET